MDYAEKLRDPRWQKKRLQILERDNWQCRACCSSEKTLHVHHLFYLKDKEPWEVPNGFLVTLCEDCHQEKNDGEESMEAFIGALGDLLDSLWKREFDFFAIVNLECAILEIEELPKLTPDRWNFELKIKIDE